MVWCGVCMVRGPVPVPGSINDRGCGVGRKVSVAPSNCDEMSTTLIPPAHLTWTADNQLWLV